jgi:glyoxylase-like metal-dependent hydrolase (beta-lactamase superfamily II)
MLQVNPFSSLRPFAWLGGAVVAVLSLAASGAEPPASKAPVIAPFEVARLGPKTWVGRFGFSNCGWVEVGSGVLVIDTGASSQDAANLQSEIKKSTGGKPVKWIVVSHLHAHANAGLPAFLPTTATVYVRSSIAAKMEALLTRMASGGKVPTVVGVKQSAVVSEGGQTVEVLAPKGAASTGVDLWVFSSEANAAFVADMVVTGRCPSMTDPESDPLGWMAELQRIAEKKPSFIMGSAGDTSTEAAAELATTGAYLERIYRIAKDTKDKGLPEARVSSQLSAIEKVGDYCSSKIDVLNGLAIYRRLGKDGKLRKGPEPPAPGGVKP